MVGVGRNPCEPDPWKNPKSGAQNSTYATLRSFFGTLKIYFLDSLRGLGYFVVEGCLHASDAAEVCCLRWSLGFRV